ncbi:hypothetical protein V2I71_18395 [Peribacillus frigoritolerans]|uniref:hypothetical protein n=1 Tax=Peribacillus frigoritolerans TaxID=450367 RepID=UPI002ED19776|nr:hypothetical protein V2I71_18395 [Peribacillus frigoritolerans]
MKRNKVLLFVIFLSLSFFIGYILKYENGSGGFSEMDGKKNQQKTSETDDTGSIQNLLDSVEDGDILTIRPGKYYVKSVTLKNKKNVQVIAEGVVLKRSGINGNTDSNLFEILKSEGITVRGLMVDGNSAKFGGKEAQVHNVAIYGSREVKLINVKSINSVCDGFYINRFFTARSGLPTPEKPINSEDITLINSHADYSTRQGLSIISVDGFLAKKSSFNNTGKGKGGSISPSAGVDLESNIGSPWEPRNLRFLDSKSVGNEGAGFITTNSTVNVVLENFLMKNNGSYGFYSASSNVKLSGVVLDNNGGSKDSVRASIYVKNTNKENKITDIFLENVVIKNGTWGGLMFEEGVRLEAENLIIKDTNNFGIRQIGTGKVTPWALTKLENIQISRIYVGDKDISGEPSYVTGVIPAPHQPTIIRGIKIDNTGLDRRRIPVKRGIDMIPYTNVEEITLINIDGNFSDWAFRDVNESK